MKIIYEPSGKAREYAGLAANLYNTCFEPNCTYCYAPKLRRTRELDVLAEIDRDAAILQKRYIKLRQSGLTYEGAKNPPVFLCFTCDPYPAIKASAMITRRAIQILHSHGLNFTILTKAGELAQRDFDLYKDGDSFGATLTFTDEAMRRKYEPGASSPADRLMNLKVAHNMGIRTWASMEPVIYPAQTLDLIMAAAPWVDEFKIGKLNHEQPPEPVDWAKFARDAVDLCNLLQKKYVIKKDLAKYLPRPTPCETTK